ncbi:MAG: thioredoxin reductase, partial [Pseudomonadota bacterium]|nr:thioredoxin reductase [Pseudomonadota bacterium]
QDHLMNKVKNGNINIIWNHTVDEVLGNDMKVTGIQLKSTLDDSIQRLETDGIFIAIGHQPNTQIFEHQIDMRNGYILIHSGVDGNATATNIPGVFACGDVADSVYRQAITSAGFGCMAALDAEKFLDSYK